MANNQHAQLFLCLLLVILISGCSSGNNNSNINQDLAKYINQDQDLAKSNNAAIENEVSICEGINNLNEKNYCLATVGGNFELCLSLDNTNYVDVVSITDKCIMITALIMGKDITKVDWCDKITFIDYKIECKAFLLEDASLCNDLDATYRISSCITSLAESSGNIHICHNFDFSIFDDPDTKRDLCYYKIFDKTGDKSVCEFIKGDVYKPSVC